jgi:predicted RNA-binding protein with PIN domain
MTYLIDGHNLIGQLPDLSLSDPDDEAKLVLKLRGFAARQKKRVVVVFDSGLPAGRSSMSNTPVEVIFASARSTADAVMIERIKRARDPGQWVVVSNDHTVIDAARARRMTVVTSAAFVSLLRTPAAPKTKRGKDKDAGESGDVYVSPDEVEAWLKLFQSTDDRDE